MGILDLDRITHHIGMVVTLQAIIHITIMDMLTRILRTTHHQLIHTPTGII
jgi:hypothetical protein